MWGGKQYSITFSIAKSINFKDICEPCPSIINIQVAGLWNKDI